MSRVVKTSGRFLVVSAAASVVAAGITAFFLNAQAGILVAVAFLVLAITVAIAVELGKRCSLVAAAAQVDRTHQLRDQISTSIELSQSRQPHDDAFVTLAIQNGERLAAEVDARQVVSLKPDRNWVYWPLLGAAAVGAALLVPRWTASIDSQADPTHIASTQAALNALADTIQSGLDEVTEPDAAEQAFLDRMDDIERELAQGRSTPEDAALEAAAVAERTAQQLDENAERERTASLAEQLEQINPAEAAEARELAEALRDSNFDSAKRTLKELTDRAQRGSDQDRQQLADDLRKLAAQLRQQEENSPPTPTSEDSLSTGESAETTQPPVTEPTTPQSEQGQQAPESSTDSDVPDDQDPSSTPDQATRDEAEQTARDQAEREAGKQDANDLADRLQDVADSLDRQDEPSRGDQQDRPTQDREPGADQNSGTVPDNQDRPQPANGTQEQPTTDPADQSTPGPAESNPQESKPSTDSQGNQGEPNEQNAQETEGGDSPPQSDPGRTGDTQNTASDSSDTSPENSEGQEGSRSDDNTSDPGSDQGAKTDSDSPAQGTPGESADTPTPGDRGRTTDEDADAQQQGDRPSSIDDASNNQSQSNDEQSNDDTKALDRAIDQFEKMNQRQRESLRKMAQSNELREQAEELLNSASPEQRQRLADLAERLRQDTGNQQPVDDWNPDTELVDASDSDADASNATRQAGTTEPTAPPDRNAAVDRSPANAAQVRDAAQAAERAIEGQAIPSRYRDYVRSVYRRFQEKSNQSPAPEGTDADRSEPPTTGSGT